METCQQQFIHIDIVSILQFPKNSTLFIEIHFCYRNTSMEYFLNIIKKKIYPLYIIV